MSNTISKKRQLELDRQEAIIYLQSLLKPGDTVYTTVSNVSRSGMSRHISCYIPVEDKNYGNGKHIKDITHWVGLAAGYRRSTKSGALVVGGCGMDMGFSVVYNLSRILFPDGFAVKGVGRNGDTSGWDKDGGYALNQRWL